MRGVRPLALALAVLLGPGAALADVPWHSLFPRPRPVQVQPAPMTPVAPMTDAAVAQALGTLPVPPPTPVQTAPEAVARSLAPRPRSAAAAARFAASRTAPAAPAQTVSRAPTTAGPVERGICGSRDLEGRRLPRITSSTRGCGVDEPVSLTAVQGIPLSRPATVHCDTARAFSRWVDDALLPTVGRRGGGVARLRVIGDYSCRTRNSQRGARLSEHARGMAIDFAGYQLANGDWVTVQDDWRDGRNGRDLLEMYRDACGIFRTTLSPDSDRYHQDHFHFDLAQHRNGGTYCR
ncbi:MAG: extensin family protein [Rhodobacter sp.]|nr:extensin family protein [Rhodobacter sp.]